MDLVAAIQTVNTVPVPAGGGDLFAPFSAAVAFLKATGPIGLAVLAGWFALRKDREAKETTAQAAAAAKASYDQMVALVGAQTTAMVKMEATIAALTGVIERMDDRERNGGGK